MYEKLRTQLSHAKDLSNSGRSVSKKMLRTDTQITQRVKQYVSECPKHFSGGGLSKVPKAVVEGVVVSFRTGPKTQRSKQCIIQFLGIKSSSEAGRLIGRKVVCATGKGAARGKVVALHGRQGLVRARFRKGLPGQIGIRVRIIG